MNPKVFAFLLVAILSAAAAGQNVPPSTTPVSSTSTTTYTSTTTSSTLRLFNPNADGLNAYPGLDLTGLKDRVNTAKLENYLAALSAANVSGNGTINYSVVAYPYWYSTSTSSTSTSTSTTICGNTPRYCAVDLDSDFDGAPDCCNNQNNPQCLYCRQECMGYCGEKGVGLELCFSEGGNATCQCSKKPPACYVYTTTTLFVDTVTENNESRNNLVFLGIIVVIFVGSISVLHFVGRIR